MGAAEGVSGRHDFCGYCPKVPLGFIAESIENAGVNDPEQNSRSWPVL